MLVGAVCSFTLWQTFLKSEDVGVQWIDLSNPAAIFILLQAKPGKGGINGPY